MSGKRWRKAASAAVLLGAFSLICAAVAIAATSKTKIVPAQRTAKSAVALAKTMMANPRQLVGAQFVIAPPQNGPNAIGSGPAGALAGFPIKSGHFAILTNGCSKRADQPKYKRSSGCNDRGPEFHGTRDTTILRVEVRVPKGASCLSFRFRFLSNEYPTWVGSDYSDAFIAEQGYYPRWRSRFQAPHLYNPDDFAKTPQGQAITINKVGVAAMTAKYARGTGYEGATQLLRASTPVKPGKRYVLFSIFDQGDRQFDSAVFIDHLTISHRSPCTSGVSKYQ
jgi:hypothetical protein